MGLSRRSALKLLGFATAVAGGGTVSYSGLNSAEKHSKVNALVAGSLLECANEVPGASVEAHGSVAVRRLVNDGLREPDAVALADPRLFEGISPEATLFATNALAVAYRPNSPHADALATDWKTAVESNGIAIGRTDPKKDPLGYRTVMALRLARRFYGVEVQTVLKNADIFLETDLLNVLEVGQLDAAFVYRNMAVQRDLPYVELPDRIDFSNPRFHETYASESYDVGDRRVLGAPIRYVATALTEPGQQWVRKFVTARELLSKLGFLVPQKYPTSFNIQR